MADADPELQPRRRSMDRLISYVRAGGLDLTNRQTAVLMLVCWMPAQHTVRGLAARLNIAKAVVTRAADTLSKLGLVERVRDPNDGRNVFIVATAAGREAVHELPYG